MQVRRFVATHADDGRYSELVVAAGGHSLFTRVDVAVAYATHTGVAELCSAMSMVDSWATAQKRWLVGIDYCRSDPHALDHLQSLNRSELRVHDGRFVVSRRGCIPRVSFHPKLYMFCGDEGVEAVVGSGNLSCTGLTRGVEAGVAIGGNPVDEMAPIATWFRMSWQRATPLGEISNRYLKAYGEATNRKHPVPVDDDEVPEGVGGSGRLSASQLRKLRVCRHFWIEAGRVSRNRGPHRPGNQLMMKRNARVFFGFQARDVERDTSIGHVAITYGRDVRRDCSLRFSNNSMDVLTLPIPGDGGPETYDGQALCLRRTGVRHFEMTVGSPGDVRLWRRRSEAIGGAFEMKGGRRWGVY